MHDKQKTMRLLFQQKQGKKKDNVMYIILFRPYHTMYPKLFFWWHKHVDLGKELQFY